MTHAAPKSRQPWPLWPIALAIVVSLAGYTYLRLAYAKPGKAHEPYADSQRRAATDQLKAAGWTQAEAAYEAVVELPAAEAPLRTLPVRPASIDELWKLAPENWHLPIEYRKVATAARIPAEAALEIHFEAALDQARVHVVGFDLYRKVSDVVLVPRWEPYPAELTPRRPQCAGRITLPAGALPAGDYTVSLPALKQTSQWTLTVDAVAAP